MLDLFNFSMLITAGGRDLAKTEATVRSAGDLLAIARLEAPDALVHLESTVDGLNPEQVRERLEKYGPNIVAQETRKHVLLQLLERFYTNPINILLTVLATITWLSGEQASDKIGALIMFAMV